MITRPEAVVTYFNEKYPSAYRQITAEDVEDMTNEGLWNIGRQNHEVPTM